MIELKHSNVVSFPFSFFFHSTGWPTCCSSDNDDCPEEQPEYDMVGMSYCTHAPNYGCYTGGWPSCCLNDSVECPTDSKDPCDLTGTSVCTFAPDYTCYRNGWPACCTEEGDTGCSDDEPCNVLYTAGPGGSNGTEGLGGTPGDTGDDLGATNPEDEEDTAGDSTLAPSAGIHMTTFYPPWLWCCLAWACSNKGSCV